MDVSTTQNRLPTRAILVICCIAQFMVVLDVAIVNVALPQMRDSLGLSVAGQQWVVNAYTLTFAGFLMLGGRAAISSDAAGSSWSASPSSPSAACSVAWHRAGAGSLRPAPRRGSVVPSSPRPP